MDCSPPGSSVHGILQARILEWVAISFSRGSSQPRDRSRVSCIADGVFAIGPPGKPSWSVLSVYLWLYRGEIWVCFISQWICVHTLHHSCLAQAAAFPLLFGMSCPLLSVWLFSRPFCFIYGLWCAFTHLQPQLYQGSVSSKPNFNFSDSSTHCDNIFFFWSFCDIVHLEWSYFDTSPAFFFFLGKCSILDIYTIDVTFPWLLSFKKINVGMCLCMWVWRRQDSNGDMD